MILVAIVTSWITATLALPTLPMLDYDDYSSNYDYGDGSAEPAPTGSDPPEIALSDLRRIFTTHNTTQVADGTTFRLPCLVDYFPSKIYSDS